MRSLSGHFPPPQVDTDAESETVPSLIPGNDNDTSSESPSLEEHFDAASLGNFIFLEPSGELQPVDLIQVLLVAEQGLALSPAEFLFTLELDAVMRQ